MVQKNVAMHKNIKNVAVQQKYCKNVALQHSKK
jgi:hypothetical protein